MKSEVAERFVRYCEIWTTSDPASPTSPSAERELDLARLLRDELTEMGLKDVYLSEFGYVYAHVDANTGGNIPTVGFIAHMDTAPDYNGKGVKPRLLENYDGQEIVLGHGVSMSPAEFPYLNKCVGKDLIITDGSTLLGADDKAGAAAIMEAVRYWQNHPEVKHGRIAIAFTPDEEIGRGTEHFDLERFGADFAYTMDGGPVDVYTDETFNAASAKVVCYGNSIHPGSAKNHMVNALNTAIEFHNLLPAWVRPEHTEGKEGYIHLVGLKGDVEHAEAGYIIRDHDRDAFAKEQDLMQKAADYVNALHGAHVLDITFTQGYWNMKEYISKRPEVVELAKKAIAELGMEPVSEAVRGGTDGCDLSKRGLPCPNLGNGGQNCHGRYEYCVVQELEMAVKLIETIAAEVAE